MASIPILPNTGAIIASKPVMTLFSVDECEIELFSFWVFAFASISGVIFLKISEMVANFIFSSSNCLGSVIG